MRIFRSDNGDASVGRAFGERFIDPRKVANFTYSQVQFLCLLKIDDGEQHCFQAVEIKRRFCLQYFRGSDRA